MTLYGNTLKRLVVRMHRADRRTRRAFRMAQARKLTRKLLGGLTG